MGMLRSRRRRGQSLLCAPRNHTAHKNGITHSKCHPQFSLPCFGYQFPWSLDWSFLAQLQPICPRIELHVSCDVMKRLVPRNRILVALGVRPWWIWWTEMWSSWNRKACDRHYRVVGQFFLNPHRSLAYHELVISVSDFKAIRNTWQKLEIILLLYHLLNRLPCWPGMCPHGPHRPRGQSHFPCPSLNFRPLLCQPLLSRTCPVLSCHRINLDVADYWNAGWVSTHRTLSPNSQESQGWTASTCSLLMLLTNVLKQKNWRSSWLNSFPYPPTFLSSSFSHRVQSATSVCN